MQAPDLPENESARIAKLQSLNLLDTSPEERFDRLTRLAARLFNVPIALVSLVDINRQWFKSCVGLPVSETPRGISFCGHAILGDDVFVIPNALADERFGNNPLVTGAPYIRFYAGCPLRVADGSKLGTLCLIDTTTRQFSAEDAAVLKDLARMAELEISAVQMATMDVLTTLSNRRGFETLAKHALAVDRRLNRPASLFYFDLNGFKAINDNFGHAEGDRALVTFADQLRGTFRECDVIGRLGGDEFAVLLTDASPDSTARVLSRLQRALDARHLAENRGYEIRYSVGCVAYDRQRHASIDQLLAEADAQMYEDKQSRLLGTRNNI
jgi:diguanylate cyclase (GGDEF)-like protein